MADSVTTGVDLEQVNVTSGPSTVNVNFDRDIPHTEYERKQWQIRQIAELRYALLGDDRYGVYGLVDAVRNQRIWLIVLTILVALVFLILLIMQFQIHQIQVLLEGLQS